MPKRPSNETVQKEGCTSPENQSIAVDSRYSSPIKALSLSLSLKLPQIPFVTLESYLDFLVFFFLNMEEKFIHWSGKKNYSLLNN